MGDSDFKKNDSSVNAKSNREIYSLLKEIKDFEKKFEEDENLLIKAEEELIEVETEFFEEVEPGSIKICEKEKEPQILKLKFKSKKNKVKKIVNPATFRLRFNKNGNLENIDFKKRKLKNKSNKRFNLNILKIIRGDKSKSTDEENESKFSKLREGLGKLKRIIPTKSKEVKTSERTDSEE